MLQIYFIRHAQTQWNLEKRIQGHMDSNLTDKGVSDARKLGNQLQSIDWTAIYTSPSKRVIRTMELIGEGKPTTIRTDERLLEMHMGEFEGLTMDEIEKESVDLHYHYWYEPTLYRNDSGETFYEVRERVQDFINDLLENHDEGNVLVITHGIIIKIIQLIFQQQDIQHIWNTSFITNTSVTKVEINNQHTEIIHAGDISHLE